MGRQDPELVGPFKQGVWVSLCIWEEDFENLEWEIKRHIFCKDPSGCLIEWKFSNE